MPSQPSNPVSKTTLKIIQKYMLNIKNAFHLRAAQQIVEEFHPHKDPNYQIKLNSRMKVSLGRQLNLLPQHLLLPRREPVYLKGVIPLKAVLIMYGVDRLSNKDMNLFVYGEPLPESDRKLVHEPAQPSNSGEVLQVIPSSNAPSNPKQKTLEITRLDTSHYGIVILNQKGKQVLKTLFEQEKESIFNVLKEVQSENQENQQNDMDSKTDPATKKLPRGWFSTKPHERSELCVRLATSSEYADGKWTIITKPLEEDLICRVNIFANTLESRTHLQQEMDTLSDFNSRRTSRLISGDFKSPLTRNPERQRSRQKIYRRSQNHSQTSPLNCDQQKNHFTRAAQQIFGKKNDKQAEKSPKQNLSKLKEQEHEDDLSQRLSRMSCDEKPENVAVDQMNNQKIIDVSVQKIDNNEQPDKRKDSDMVSEGEIDMNDLVDSPSKIKMINARSPNLMVEQSSQNHEATTQIFVREKLINSFNEISAKHSLANHPDIYKIKKIEKYRVDPSSKFSYSRYKEERQLEQRLQRRKMKIRRRQIKDIAKASSRMVDENQSIPIFNLISEDQGPIRKIGKDISSTSGNDEFEAMDGMPIPQCSIEETYQERPRNFARRIQQRVIVHYEKKMQAEKSVSPKSNRSKGSKSPSAEKRKALSKSPESRKNKMKGSRSNRSHSIPSQKAKSVRKNSSNRSISPPSRKNEPQSAAKSANSFLFVNRDEPNRNFQDKPQQQRRNNRFNNGERGQNNFSGNQRRNFDSRNERSSFRRDENGNGQRNFQRRDGQNSGFQRRDGQNGGFQRGGNQNGGYQRRDDENDKSGENERRSSFGRNNEESKAVKKMNNVKAQESADDDGGMDY